ncbi:SCO7613 C-terminal domain-containing membrane protein [Microbacterium sp. NPDC058389]|uniref:SCO7613 C-terminal domain-containing membrane protein n=1 Tax=Microbacterium sp. NPDC058389 TaxID=3346475 RepID=UPI00364E4EC7
MSTVAHERRSPAWNDKAIAELLDVVRCPVCAGGIVSERRCPTCGADFDGPIGRDLWLASQRAVEALKARQAVLDRVPSLPVPPAPAAATPGAGMPGAAASTIPAPGAGEPGPPLPPVHRTGDAPVPAPGASASVQSVLAVAGAGLVAVAALVFTFFNPDLDDPIIRTGIVGAIAAAFLGGAPLLARRRLRLSAEAIGALGVVFLALTVTAALPFARNGWVSAGLVALVAGGALALLGPRAHIRAWLWCGVVALAFAPLLLALGAGSALVATAGCLTSAAAASALIALTRGGAERVTLTIAQLVFAATAVALIPATVVETGLGPAWIAAPTLLGVAAVAVAATYAPTRGLWSGIAGAALVGAATSLTLGALGTAPVGGAIALLPTTAGAGLVLVGVLTPLHRLVSRGALFTGAVLVVAVIAAAPTLMALLALAAGIARPGAQEALLPPDSAWGLPAGLFALALTLASFAAITRDDAAGRGAASTPPGSVARDQRSRHVADAPDAADSPQTGPGVWTPTPLGTRWLGFLGAWYAVLAFLTVLALPAIDTWARIAVGLGAAVCASAVVLTVLRDASASVRMPLVVGAHAAVVYAAVLSWADTGLAVAAGPAVVAAAGVLMLTVPRPARFVHVALGFAYALVVLATALDRSGTDAIVAVCLTTCAAGVVAIAVTFARRVRLHEWYAVLTVTAVPFAVGVAQVLFERSGWTALSTAVIFCLALTLVTTTRPGLGLPVRTLAAATLVPALAVVAVCLGAQLLPMSGSPVVLPVIAGLVAVTLAAGDSIGTALARRLPRASARAAGLAIEASALLTAAIAVGLALVRTAAGLPTTLLVLLILGAGFAVTAVLSPRRYAWPLAGAALTGALWTAWGLAGVTGLEPYVLPPALGAAAVAAVLTARGRRATGLYTAGLGVAVIAVLLVAAAGRDAGLPALPGATGSEPRTFALVAAAWLLTAASLAVRRVDDPRVRRLRGLTTPTLAFAITAAAGAAVQGVRWGTGMDAAPTDPAIVGALLFGVIGAGAAASAARLLHRSATPGALLARTRWLGAPAVLIVGLATWPAIERDWVSIWTMWGLAVALLTLLVVVAARGLRGPTALPPVPFLFAVSFVTAVVAWSPRDLRVEWFSLPLGLFLLAAGALAMQHPGSRVASPSLRDWPAGWSGSWALLGPGLLVTLSASVAATYTDPRTWRAILVMAIALVAILVGATLRLAAPFLIGIVVLPVENVLAFVVQIGRGIEAMPWWITLSVVGAVLLIIAVAYERRAGEGSGLTARLRDLA